jgi:3-deoxy-D-manno-octulosonic-acid transferase
MPIILFLAYNIVFFPIFYIAVHIAGLFHEKVKAGLEGRRVLYRQLAEKLHTSAAADFVVWIHSSSMGEFEQGRPVIYAILKKFPRCRIIATIFSPSGYDHIKIDDKRIIVSYLPIDSAWDAKKFLHMVRPNVAIVVRHDIWPNFQWRLKALGIPSLLIDASISDRRQRTFSIFRHYHRAIYSTFSFVIAVSALQAKRLRFIYPDSTRLLVANDTRYDQVYRRSLEKGKIDVLIKGRYFKREKCIVAGSTWPQDEKHLFPAVAQAMHKSKDLKIIIVPHEINVPRIHEITEFFKSEGIPFCTYSKLLSNKQTSFRVLLIDSYGILANLYSLGLLAYVGGGFGLGINSILEPSAQGAFVIFGPRHQNVPESKILIQRGGAVTISNSNDIFNEIQHMLNDPHAINVKGQNAKKMVLDNVGASDYIVKVLERYLTPHAVKNINAHKSGSLYG